jgi:hypothetical protein
VEVVSPELDEWVWAKIAPKAIAILETGDVLGSRRSGST